MSWIKFPLLLLFSILQVRLWMGGGSITDMNRLKKAIEAQEQEIALLVDRNQILEAEVQDLKKFPNAVEEQARTELGLIKRGETFCQIIQSRAME